MADRMNGYRGVAALEFLLVVPLLALLFFGIMSLSLAAALRADLHMAARAGAQWAIGSLERTDDLAGTVAAAEAAAADLPVTVTTTAQIRCGCLDPGSAAFTPVDCSSGVCPLADPRPLAFVKVTVAAQYPFPWAIPGLPELWQLESSAELRVR